MVGRSHRVRYAQDAAISAQHGEVATMSKRAMKTFA
jgi:hypothetical protein